MSLKEQINARHNLMCSIHKIDKDIWELLKQKKTELHKKSSSGKRIYAILCARLHKRRTLEDVAKEFGVTRERIRQLEAKGIEIVEYL